jgi:uroporphyrinogen-III synthase
MRRLSGARVVVTRAAHQAEPLAQLLRELGAEVVLAPLIGIGPPADLAPLREAAAQCDEYDWILFTSANAVAAFRAELAVDKTTFHAKFAAIGTATREAAEASGFPIAIVPREYIAEELVESLTAETIAGRRVLIPSAAVTRDIVPDALRKIGARVDVVEAYRNVVPAGARERLAEVLREPFPDWIAFASPSAVENAVALAGDVVLRRLKIATIGPVTSEAVRKYGLAVTAEAVPHTVEGLVAAMCK